MPSPTIQPRVSPSGQGVFFLFEDGQGAPSMVTGVSDNNEVQSVGTSGRPSGGAFALSFGGQTTAAIPTVPADPYGSFRWRKALPAGSYDLAVNIQAGGNSCPSVSYQVFDGSTAIGAPVLLNHYGSGQRGGPANPSPFPDASSPTPLQQDGHSGNGGGNGVTLPWYPLGRFTLPTGDLSVLITGDDGFGVFNVVMADCLRVATPDGSTVRIVSAAAPSGLPSGTAAYGAGNSYQAWPEPDSSPSVNFTATGSATRYLIDPSTLQSALQAITSIGPGNLVTPGGTAPHSPVQLKFLGNLSDAAQPLVTCADSAIQVARVTPGATLPALTITRASDGSVVRHQCRASERFYHALTPAMPTCHFLFTQDAPDVEYLAPKTYESDGQTLTFPGYWAGWSAGYPANATAQVLGSRNPDTGSNDPALTGTWRRPVRPAGTYALAVAYPHDPGYSTDVVYTVRDTRGNLLATVHADQTAAPTGAVDRGVPWLALGTFTLPPGDDNNGFAVTIANNSTGIMVADALRVTRTGARAALTIGPGDVVAATYGAGWATCQAGVAVAGTDVPVTNLVGQTIHGPLPTTTAMKVGLNTPSPQTTQPCSYYSDYFHMTAYGAYPTDLGTQPTQPYPVNLTYPTYGADGRSYGAIPPGDYDLWWDGPDDATMQASPGTCVPLSSAITGGRDNRRTYRVGASPWEYGPQLTVTLHGHPTTAGRYGLSVTNVRLYEAGTDLATVPYFRPERAARCAGHGSRRNLNPLAAITGSLSDLADYLGDLSRPTRGGLWRTVDAPVYRVEQYAGPIPFPTFNGNPYLITSGDGAGGIGPHGLANWQYASMQNWSGGVAQLSDGLGHAGTYDLGGLFGHVWVIGPTQFVMMSYDTANAPGPDRPNPLRMTNVLTNASPGARVHVDVGTNQPLADIVRDHNDLGLDLYFNTCFSVTDACLTGLGDYLGRNLRAGLKLRVECSNETWNVTNAPFALAAIGGAALYGGAANDDVAFKCEQSHRHWTLMLQGWQGAGRSAADFVRVMGGQHGYSGRGRAIAAYCAGKGYAFDEFAVAPYFDCRPALTRDPQPEAGFADVLDRLTADQTLDLWDDYVTHGGYDTEIQAHRDEIAGKRVAPDGTVTYDYPQFRAVPIIFYESGPEYLTVLGSPNSTGHRLGHAVARHPRWYGIDVTLQDRYAQSGVTLAHRFEQSVLDQLDSAQWGVYTHTKQLPYVPGDPAQDAIQINTPDDLYATRSVSGGALNYMASIYMASGLGPATPADTPRPRRFFHRIRRG